MRVSVPGVDEQARKATNIFQVVAVRPRVVIVDMLSERDMYSGEIADALGMLRTHASAHLRHLVLCGLVDRRRAGLHVAYGLTDMGREVAGLIRMIEES